MGLTHSWLRPTELPAKQFAAAVKDIQIVLGSAGVPLAGFHGDGEPIVREETVVFNGASGAGCEPFEIHLVEFDRRGRPHTFSFCKTQGLPYDIAVKAALIAFKQHLGELVKVMSDESDDEWADARMLVERLLGYGARFKLDPRM